MSDSDAPLTQPQMQLMAYIDDEMTAQERADFEKQLSEDTALAAEVAEFRSIEDITKALQVAEPTDHEMRRFWESFYNRSEWQLGWVLFIGGMVILTGWGLIVLLQHPVIPTVVKAGCVTALTGGSILFWNVLRMKIRTHRFDRYRGVMR